MSVSLLRRHEPLPLTITVRPGAALVRQGEPSPAVRRLQTGAARETIVIPEGRELTLGILGPGDVVGEPEGEASASTVRTLRVCRLRPVTASDAADLLAARARRAASLAIELAWSDVPTRLLARLRDLAERFGRPADGGTMIPFALTQDDLGHMTGSSRETVNRALRTLVADGLVRVVPRGRYVVDVPRPVVDPAIRSWPVRLTLTPGGN